MVNPPHHRPRDDENEKRTGPSGAPGLGGGPNLNRTSQGRHAQPQRGRDPYSVRPGNKGLPENEPYGKARPKSKPLSAAEEVMAAGMGKGKKAGTGGGGAAPAKKPGGCPFLLILFVSSAYGLGSAALDLIRWLI